MPDFIAPLLPASRILHKYSPRGISPRHKELVFKLYPKRLLQSVELPSDNGRPRTTIDELARRLRSEMIPLNNNFSYFPVLPVAEEDLRQYLHEPVAALPAAACELLPKVGIVLAPYLERAQAKGSAAVVYEKPPEPKLLFSARAESDGFRHPVLYDQGRAGFRLSLLLLRSDCRAAFASVARRDAGRLPPRAARGTERGSAWRSG